MVCMSTLVCMVVAWAVMSPTVQAVRVTPQQHEHGRRLSTKAADPVTSRRVEVPAPTSPKDHLVTDLPYLDADTLTAPHYAGLLPASANQDKYFFYWFFHPDKPALEKRTDLAEDDVPLILWLNGGPGCSSMDGLFIENGPLQLVHNGRQWSLEQREFSWHKTPAYTVYVDQPVGTGLSFTTGRNHPRNDDEVNVDFYYWLKEFLTLHANVLLNDDGTALRRPFFFSGESHAGHYIPHMIDHILQQNKEPNAMTISVSGALIGNGWMDPYHQYAAATAAYGYGLIDLAQKNAFDELEQTCQRSLAKGNYRVNTCFDLLDTILNQAEGAHGQYTVSQYDVTKMERSSYSREYPPGHKDVEAYLGGKRANPPMNDITVDQVLKALHATPSRKAGQVYKECTDPPYNALSHQDGKGVVQNVVNILEDTDSNTRLLFFNGMLDMICNHVGNEIFLQKMEWSGQEDWILAPRSAWVAPSQHDRSKVSGYIKEYNNLSFLKILDAGHMVPMDLPDVSLDMVQAFVFHSGFGSHTQTLRRSLDPAPKDCPTKQCKVCPECEVCDDNKDEDEPDADGDADENNSRAATMNDESDKTYEKKSKANKHNKNEQQSASKGAVFSRSVAVGILMVMMVLAFFVGRYRAQQQNAFRRSLHEIEMRFPTMTSSSFQDGTDDDDDDNDDDDSDEDYSDGRPRAHIQLI